jgi:hypothetical protein
MKAPAFRSEGWGFAVRDANGKLLHARSGYANERSAVVQGRRYAQRLQAGKYVFHVLDPTGRVHEPVEVVSHGRTDAAPQRGR